MYASQSAHVLADALGYYYQVDENDADRLAVAFGFINSGGSLASRTESVSSNWNAVSLQYDITITGESYYCAWTMWAGRSRNTEIASLYDGRALAADARAAAEGGIWPYGLSCRQTILTDCQLGHSRGRTGTAILV